MFQQGSVESQTVPGLETGSLSVDDVRGAVDLYLGSHSRQRRVAEPRDAMVRDEPRGDGEIHRLCLYQYMKAIKRLEQGYRLSPFFA
ncbi:hypothetical protein FG05_35178 [Fusarium graminearum]|nr:hypothetical protein FG05_35178 [Fusarium graminearum]